METSWAHDKLSEHVVITTRNLATGKPIHAVPPRILWGRTKRTTAISASKLAYLDNQLDAEIAVVRFVRPHSIRGGTGMNGLARR